ncbi:MAG: DUF447 domain-containing protein [Candidatus Methylomirabilales bacterium]
MPFILESIVITQDENGLPNFAPMGVTFEGDSIFLRPYKETTTYTNLVATGQAVINLTDNVLLFAEGAVGQPQFPTFPAQRVKGLILQDACIYYECTTRDLHEEGERARFPCTVLKKGVLREFIGFNRAKNAVVEAAILATRVRFLGQEHVLTEFKRLREIVHKTGGEQEHTAFQYLFENVTGSHG